MRSPTADLEVAKAEVFPPAADGPVRRFSLRSFPEDVLLVRHRLQG